jgi:hypothetical protein
MNCSDEESRDCRGRIASGLATTKTRRALNDRGGDAQYDKKPARDDKRTLLNSLHFKELAGYAVLQYL